MNQSYRKEQKLVLWVVAIGLAALIAAHLPFAWVNRSVSLTVYPLLRVHAYCVDTIHNWSRTRVERSLLVNALYSQEQELQSLRERIHALEQEQVFYNEIKDLVEFRKRFGGIPTIISQVLKRDISPARQVIWINAGARAGVEAGMIAVNGEYLIGKVTEVYPLYAKVSLITDAGIAVAVMAETNKATGVLRGANKSHALDLLYVDHLTTLTPHDRIISSGEGLVFPRGFLIGTIETDVVESVYHRATIKPFLSFNDLKQVLLFKMDQLQPPLVVPAVESTTIAAEKAEVPAPRRRRAERVIQDHLAAMPPAPIEKKAQAGEPIQREQTA